MTNDNTPPDDDQRRLQGKFDAAIAMVVDTFLEAGLHPVYMVDPLQSQVIWAKDAGKDHVDS